ncbi:MAG: helix-turn-helix domain-containing protein [Actinomycetia bacterium]|nr:helix-turn-helix domain-containing protein [Actinomycetes bacterium]
MAVFAPGDRHRVAVLVRHGLLPMELGLAHQLFAAAVDAGGRPLYQVVTCTLVPGDIHTAADFTLHVAHGPAALVEADTVLVPAAIEDYHARAGRLDGSLAEALAAIRPGTRIASICTGAFVLAAAGMLDGCRATTHWKSCDRFRRLYPHIELDPNVLYTDNGEVLTSAGEAAGVDLCLHLIRRDHGAAVAADVARAVIVPPHREGGQAQYIPRPVAERTVSTTGAARAWALEHIDRPLTLRELAAHATTSTRTFTRRFREEVGLSPQQWLTEQRLHLARELLEQTSLPVDQVAADAGFGTAASLRQHLHAALGVSPSAYRTTFRGPAARAVAAR